MTHPTITKELVVQLAREAGFSMENSAAMQAAENLVNASYKLGRNAGLEALEQTQGKAVAYAAFADNGNIRIWTSVPEDVKRLADRVGFALTPLYTHSQSSEPAPSTAGEQDWLLKSTQDLAKAIAHANYPDVPQFEVMDNLAGVISQIDNMTCGMVRAHGITGEPK